MYKILDKIDSPKDLKRLPEKELVPLCAEIRDFLVNSVAKTGGHLASNLGVVELTVALHRVFSTPNDKIIWDVGHQSYVHKILTGRKSGFENLRRQNGLTGFPNSGESKHDAFGTGHASTSISSALGFAAARDLSGENYNVVAVIGDGSLTGGLAYEGINNAGKSDTNLIVILNDNQMSISENVGALSRYLNRIRTAPKYLVAKSDIEKILKKVPLVGKNLSGAAEKLKDGIRYLLVPGAMFEEMGFKYIGPVDGHNLKDLLGVLNKVKRMDGPVLVHVYTRKGKGYDQAEESPSAFHGVDSFNVETGEPITTKVWGTYSDVFGRTLTRIAARNPKVAAVTAAMPSGVGLTEFAEKFPERMFDVGIAEGHAVTFAAGMAKAGMTPVVSIYSSFLQRAYDNILHDVCIQNLHVVFCVDRAGVVGEDGATHQGLYDIAYLSHIPNMTYMAPKNKREFIEMLDFAINRHAGPIAIRYPKGAASVVLKNTCAAIEHGRAEVIEKGEKLAFVAVGNMMDAAYEACRELRREGLSPGLINARFIKPVDKSMVRSLAGYDMVFALEDHTEGGGFGSILLAAMHAEGVAPVYFHSFSFPDEFIGQGRQADLHAEYGLDRDGILRTVREALEMGERGNSGGNLKSV
ncbi:MAG: 1-deoxy-D-xylulose-5-phosphate synthase [Defluviitaleaceae bacterium]|nr:1-deoxy-D-xylulose-5-phosphate synthase [Defluviitaleaceae bacterium]